MSKNSDSKEKTVNSKPGMHPNSLENLKKFKPGQSGNPSGRPKIPEPVKKAMKMNQEQLAISLTKWIYTPMSEIIALIKDRSEIGNLQANDAMIVSVISYCYKHGDYRRLEALWLRICGPPPQEVEFKGETLSDFMWKLAQQEGKV